MQKKDKKISSTMPPPYAIKAEDLTVSYHKKIALWDIDLEIPKGVLMAIVGPNGAGKSTFIKAFLNLIPKASGKSFVLGEPYEKKSVKKKVGYVPQTSSIDWDFPIKVFDLVLMGFYGKLGWFRRIGEEEKHKAMLALKQVGMEQFADRQISELSGGQQQRSFLARALVQEADIYFLDEPFAGVDATTEKTIASLFKKMVDQNKTLIVVHHDLQTIEEYYTHITFMNIQIIATGDIKTTFNDKNLRLTYDNQTQTTKLTEKFNKLKTLYY